MSTNYISLLRCGHSAFLDPPPAPGDTVLCRRCNGYTQVQMSAQEWSWKCPTCHTSRPFGTDESTARRSGRTHQRKYHHVVLIRKGYDTIDTLGPEGSDELSIAGERIQWVRQHQGALKALVDKRTVGGKEST